MKRIFNIFIFCFIFAFTLVLSLLSEQSIAHTQLPIKTTGFIQNIQKENVVLISNNIQKSEITSRQKNNNSFTDTNLFFVNYNSINYSSDKTTLQFSGEYTHNLSKSNKKTNEIRAP